MKEKVFFNTHFLNLFLSVFLIVLTGFTSFSQEECKTSLTAEHNRVTKTIEGSDFTYKIFLENTGKVTREYNIQALNNNTGCKNPDGMPAGSNIDLLIKLMNSEMNLLEAPVELASGETITLYVKLSVPEESRFDAWNCAVVKAESEGCLPVNLVLHTFYPNPENLE